MIRKALAAGAVLLVAAHAAAQLPANFQLPNVEYNPLLLINASVQKELKMAPPQAAKVQNAFMQEAMRLMPAVMAAPAGSKPAMTPQQRTKAVYAGIQTMQTHLAAMLSAPQRARLRQLTLQSIGPSAVLQPKVAAALGLSPAQKDKLDEAIGDANSKLAGDLSRGGTAQNFQTRLNAMARLQAQAKAAGEQALRGALTEPQRAKWRAMLGKPFKLTGFLGAGSLGNMMGGG